jgi:hypothetical protein
MRLKEWLIKNNVSYQKLADAVGSNCRVLHRWAHQDIPQCILIASRIVEVTNGEVTVQDLAEEYLRGKKLNNKKNSN